MTYFSVHPTAQNIMVIDIGGGTSDISVISWGENVCEVLSIDGTTDIGGIDFNNLLYSWYIGKLKEKYNIVASQITKTAEVIIKDEIEVAKKELTDNKISKIYLPYLQINSQFLNEEFTISQSEFEELSHGLVDRILKLIEASIKQYKANSFLLLGGAGNTFGIKERIIKELNSHQLKE
jgi:molecular chaperone DnaK